MSPPSGNNFLSRRQLVKVLQPSSMTEARRWLVALLFGGVKAVIWLAVLFPLWAGFCFVPQPGSELEVTAWSCGVREVKIGERPSKAAVSRIPDLRFTLSSPWAGSVNIYASQSWACAAASVSSRLIGNLDRCVNRLISSYALFWRLSRSPAIVRGF